MKALYHIRILLACLALVGHPRIVPAQAVPSPESVTFDPATGNYYISSPGSSSIYLRDPGGNLSVFQPSSPNCQSPKGLCLIGNTLYAADLVYVRGYDLSTGALVFNLNVPGAAFLNDLVADPAGTLLYASDNQQHKIFLIDLAGQSASAWLSTGLNSPNGLYYDASVGRLIVVEFTTFATIKSVNLTTQQIVTLVANPPGNLDGIARDSWGYWYVSSWTANKVVRYPPNFLGTPQEVTVTQGALSGPADILVNTSQNPDVLAIPSMTNNMVYYVSLSWTDLSPAGHSPAFCRVGQGTVMLTDPRLNPGMARLQLIDGTGKVVRQGDAFTDPSNPLILETGILPSGCYLVRTLQGQNQMIHKINIP